MKPIATDIYTFSEMIGRGLVYVDKTAADALAQIKAKRYHEKFLSSGKRVTLLGMNFSSEKRAVDDWTSQVVA